MMIQFTTKYKPGQTVAFLYNDKPVCGRIKSIEVPFMITSEKYNPEKGVPTYHLELDPPEDKYHIAYYEWELYPDLTTLTNHLNKKKKA